MAEKGLTYTDTYLYYYFHKYPQYNNCAIKLHSYLKTFIVIYLPVLYNTITCSDIVVSYPS